MVGKVCLLFSLFFEVKYFGAFMQTQITRLLISGLILLVAAYPSWGLNTRKIDAVRKKTILADEDFRIIDGFVQEAMAELLETTDTSQMVELRTTVVSRSSSQEASAQIQYGPAFTQAAQKHIPPAIGKALQGQGVHKQTGLLITFNIMLMLHDTNIAELAKLALPYVDFNDIKIQYAAVKTLTNPLIVSELQKWDNLPEMVSSLEKVAQSASEPRILISILDFAGRLNNAAAVQLIRNCADARLSLYAQSNIADASVDRALLDALAAQIAANDGNRATLGPKYAQLYSYLIQSYIEIINVEGKEQLRSQLATAIINGETVLYKFINGTPGGLKRAVEKAGTAALQSEHDAIFGSDAAGGQLPAALGFDYGTDGQGNKIRSPGKLPGKSASPPEKTT